MVSKQDISLPSAWAPWLLGSLAPCARHDNTIPARRASIALRCTRSYAPRQWRLNPGIGRPLLWILARDLFGGAAAALACACRNENDPERPALESHLCHYHKTP